MRLEIYGLIKEIQRYERMRQNRICKLLVNYFIRCDVKNISDLAENKTEKPHKKESKKLLLSGTIIQFSMLK